MDYILYPGVDFGIGWVARIGRDDLVVMDSLGWEGKYAWHSRRSFERSNELNSLVTKRSTLHLDNGVERQVQNRNASTRLVRQPTSSPLWFGGMLTGFTAPKWVMYTSFIGTKSL